MRFRDELVYVRVGDDGRPVLDRDGRAEMKYRETDPKSYRPSVANLTPAGADADAPEPAPRPKRVSKATAPAKRAPAIAAAAHEIVHVWTDGACSGNPGPMGIGIVVIKDGKRLERGEYLGIGTNNIAELTAIERGVQLAGELAPGLDAPLRVYTDSQYAIGLLSMGWKAKANQELVARLRKQLADVPRLEFVKVAGHAGIPDNERCDELARTAILTRRNT
jgi:ribonuclease HI